MPDDVRNGTVRLDGNMSKRILLVFEYLYSQTDEEHTTTVSDLAAYLMRHGIEATRKSIYADIKNLSEMGVDIIVQRCKQNHYFVGDRLFQLPELKMLVDAVASSKIISRAKSAVLIDKLCKLTSVNCAQALLDMTCLTNRVKPENEQIYYLIDTIQSAILAHRRITFQYYEYTAEKKKVLRHGGARYLFDPYALTWKNDHYYLVGFAHKHQDVAHFRVDRLHSVEIQPEAFPWPEEFDVAAYTNTVVEMYRAGMPERITLRCENELMRVVIDEYGENVDTEIGDERHFLAHVVVAPSPTFYGWVYKFVGGIRIVSPTSCVNAMREIAQKFVD